MSWFKKEPSQIITFYSYSTDNQFYIGRHTEEGVAQIDDEVSTEMTVASKDLTKATVDYSTSKASVKVSETNIFEVTKAEVEEKLKAFEATLTNEAGDIEKEIEKMEVTID